MNDNAKLQKVDVIIVGAGAAGLFAASIAGEQGKEVYLLEHNKQVGRKILISGGGRCNFTNIYSNSNDFQSQNPHFSKSALSRFTPEDFIELLDDKKIPYFEKKLGQLFCKTSAKEIISLLTHRLKKQNIRTFLNVGHLTVEKRDDSFFLSDGMQNFQCKDLIVATGGLSIPTIGASNWGYELAKQFGHNIIDPFPALVPFKWQGFSDLSGTSLVGKVSAGKESVTEDILFTHRGLSGPAILKISLFWHQGDSITVDWLPEKNILHELKLLPGKTKLFAFLKTFFPKSFILKLLSNLALNDNLTLGDLSKGQMIALENFVHQMDCKPDGTEGYRKAEVTRGGVDTSQISSKTMESKLVENLYFIGEVLDVTGQLGGHNFQWAWASAFAAGSSVF